MIGNVSSSLAGSALGAYSSVTANSYSAFQLVSVPATLVGAGAVLLLLCAIAFAPKLVLRILSGYFFFGGVGVLLYVTYVVYQSAADIGNFILNGFLGSIGNFILEYWLSLLLSLPAAYLAGSKWNIFEEDKK